MNNCNDIISALVNTGKWDEISAKMGIRANFKCEYCGKDLLSSVDNYKEWQKDHIIPLSKGGMDNEANIALSCRTCNVNIKNKWNPMVAVGENPTRKDLIEAVREYVSQKRTELLKEVCDLRGIVFQK